MDGLVTSTIVGIIGIGPPSVGRYLGKDCDRGFHPTQKNRNSHHWVIIVDGKHILHLLDLLLIVKY